MRVGVRYVENSSQLSTVRPIGLELWGRERAWKCPLTALPVLQWLQLSGRIEHHWGHITIISSPPPVRLQVRHGGPMTPAALLHADVDRAIAPCRAGWCPASRVLEAAFGLGVRTSFRAATGSPSTLTNSTEDPLCECQWPDWRLVVDFAGCGDVRSRWLWGVLKPSGSWDRSNTHYSLSRLP